MRRGVRGGVRWLSCNPESYIYLPLSALRERGFAKVSQSQVPYPFHQTGLECNHIGHIGSR